MSSSVSSNAFSTLSTVSVKKKSARAATYQTKKTKKKKHKTRPPVVPPAVKAKKRGKAPVTAPSRTLVGRAQRFLAMALSVLAALALVALAVTLGVKFIGAQSALLNEKKANLELETKLRGAQQRQLLIAGEMQTLRDEYNEYRTQTEKKIGLPHWTPSQHAQFEQDIKKAFPENVHLEKRERSIAVTIPSSHLYKKNDSALAQNGQSHLKKLTKALSSESNLAITLIGHAPPGSARPAGFDNEWSFGAAMASSALTHLKGQPQFSRNHFTIASPGPTTAKNSPHGSRLEIIFSQSPR